MYKVFFNDSSIQLASNDKKSLKNNITQMAVADNYEFVNELITKIETEGISMNFIILNDNPYQLWHSLKKQLIELPAAGGLVMNKQGALLFIKRLGVWDLPKGKIEKKESPEGAAIREVEEECGITGLKIIRPLDSTFHIYRSPYLNLPDNLILKETKWFLMSCNDQQSPIPQVEENIEEVKWFTLNELDIVMKNTYSSIREFLEKTIPLI